MNDKTTTHNYQIDNLRALAIIMVVFGHSIIIYSSAWNLYSSVYSVPALDYIKSAINLIQMPLFFSLSGFLFIFSVDKRKFTAILKNKLVRLLIPYIFIALLWLLPIRLLLNYPGYQDTPLWLILVKSILYGADNGHLWYLLTLFWCFVLGTILHKVLVKIRGRIVIIFIVSILMFTIAHFINVYYFNQLFLNYCWFVLGEIIAANYSWLQKQGLCLKAIVSLIAIATSAYSLFVEGTGVIKAGIGFVSSLFLVLLLFLCIPSKKNSMLAFISSCSFGLYLFHSPLVYITYTYIPNAYPLIVVSMNFIVFGGLALFMTYIIKKTRLKIIIGE